MHLSLDAYLLVLRGHLPVEQILRFAHRHLLESCASCSAELEAYLEEGSEAVPEPPGRELPLPKVPAPFSPRTPLPADSRLIGREHLEQRLSTWERVQYLRDLTRRHLRQLLDQPPATWSDHVEKARTRYRTRAFAERLLDESRQRVRNDPALARALAALVHDVLHWLPGAEDQDWAFELAARAVAWEANALRVAGDLPAADRKFASLPSAGDRRRRLTAWCRAELLSLEASLRIDQGRLTAARTLLEEARLRFERLGDPDAEARVLVQLGNLLFRLDQPEGALEVFECALEKTAEGETSHLASCIAHGQLAALTVLERYGEAQRLLHERADVLHMEGAHGEGVVLHQRGRIALGLGDLEQATTWLQESQQRFLAAERILDALLASLDLAQALLESGDLDQLEALASDLLEQFRARGVVRETLASIRLLADAAAARQVNQALLLKLRRGLRTGSTEV